MNKKAIIAIVVVAICIVAVGVGYPIVKEQMIKNDPIGYLIYASSKSQGNAVDASLKGSFSMDDQTLSEMTTYMSSDPDAMATFVKGIVNDINFDGRIKFKADLENKVFNLYENIGFNYQDNSLLKTEFGYVNNEMFMRFPGTYEKALTMNKDELFKMIKDESDIDLTQVNWDKYWALLDVENDPNYKAILENSKPYEDLLRLFLADLKNTGKVDVTLADGKTLSCDNLQVSIKFDQVIDLYLQLFKTAKADENVKTFAKAKATEALTLVQSSGDYELMGLEEADIQEAIDQLNDEFDTNWDSMFDEMISTYEELQSNMAQIEDMNFNYEFNFAIDKDFKLRQYHLIGGANGVVVDETVVYNAYGDDVKFDETFSAENKISIAQMIEDTDYATEIGQDMIQTGLDTLLSSEALAKTIDDIKSKADVLPDDEKSQIIDSLDFVLTNKDMIINSMLGQY